MARMSIHDKTETVKVKVIDYFDVWGNKKDGYEINNMCEAGVFEARSTDTKDLIRGMKDMGFMKSTVRRNMLDVDDYNYDTCTEFSEKRTGRPFCRCEWGWE